MQRRMIRLAMFDMAGTTVNDVVEGYPLVIGATKRAFARHGIVLPVEWINAQRGREKKEMIAGLLRESGGPATLLERIYATFLAELERGLAAVTEIEGAGEVFQKLRRRGIKVGLGSGFPTDVVDKILSHLGWRAQGLVDYYASAEQVGEGRPSPKMIQMAMAEIGIADPREVVKIGDTVMDIQEGKNAGVWTVAVLTGSQARRQLAAAGPDYILPSIRELPPLLAGPPHQLEAEEEQR